MKAILFDFWGTLVENGTYSPLKQSFKILRLRMPYGEYVERFEKVLMTEKYPDQQSGFEAICDEFGIRPTDFLIDRLIGVWNKNKLLAKPFPETTETLKKLKAKYKIAIVSNAPHNSVHEILEKFEMKELFDEIIVSSDYGMLKTNGLFGIALEKLGIDKKEAVMVGDSMQSDIAGAEKAGIRAILIDRKGRREYEDKIRTLDELEAKL
jgi:2-haloalkanoic acid dehalogenase type II